MRTYIVWLLASVLAAKVCIVAVAIRVAVFEPSKSYQSVSINVNAASCEGSPSSKVPVPKFKQRYGSVPTTSHHFMNSSVPNSFDSVPIQASSGLHPDQYDMIGRVKCGVLPSRSILPGTNAIQPMICSHKVTTGVSYYRHIKIFECIDDIFTEAVLV